MFASFQFSNWEISREILTNVGIFSSDIFKLQHTKYFFARFFKIIYNIDENTIVKQSKSNTGLILTSIRAINSLHKMSKVVV